MQRIASSKNIFFLVLVSHLVMYYYKVWLLFMMSLLLPGTFLVFLEAHTGQPAVKLGFVFESDGRFRSVEIVQLWQEVHLASVIPPLCNQRTESTDGRYGKSTP